MSTTSQVSDPWVNTPLPSLDIPLPKIQGLQFVQGGAIDFDNISKEKVVLVIFLLNTQHDECISNLQHLNYLHSEYDQHKNFAMVAVFKESREAVERFYQQHRDQIPFPIAIDTQRGSYVSDHLRQAANVPFEHPVAFVIDQNSKIQWAGKPQKPGLEVSLTQLLGLPEHSHPSGSPSTWSDEVLKHLSVGELKKILFDANVHDIHGVLEKQELINIIHSLPSKAA